VKKGEEDGVKVEIPRIFPKGLRIFIIRWGKGM